MRECDVTPSRVPSETAGAGRQPDACDQCQQHRHNGVCLGCPPFQKAIEERDDTQKKVTGMSQVSWKILPWHRRLSKLKSFRPDYKSELGVFSNGSTVLQLKDVKHGFGTDSLLPSDIYTFVFILEYAYWSYSSVTPDDVSPLHAATASCRIRCCLSCPGEHHVGVKPEVGVNTAAGAWANPAHAATSSCLRRLALALPAPARSTAGSPWPNPVPGIAACTSACLRHEHKS